MNTYYGEMIALAINSLKTKKEKIHCFIGYCLPQTLHPLKV